MGFRSRTWLNFGSRCHAIRVRSREISANNPITAENNWIPSILSAPSGSIPNRRIPDISPISPGSPIGRHKVAMAMHPTPFNINRLFVIVFIFPIDTTFQVVCSRPQSALDLCARGCARSQRREATDVSVPAPFSSEASRMLEGEIIIGCRMFGEYGLGKHVLQCTRHDFSSGLLVTFWPHLT